MIYSCVPRMVERMWGSIPGPRGVPVGELWWLWDDGTDSSRLTDLSGEPSTLGLGDLAGAPGPFPVMIKTLHPAGMLSLQVHPGRIPGSRGKAETWIILEAQPGAFIYVGLKPGVTPGSLREAVDTGRIEPLLERRGVVAGNMVHIGPGTVHCLCGGIDVLEVQQNCDITYRIWDWGRTGVDGRPRETHLDEALESIDFGSGVGTPGLTGVPRGTGYTIDSVPPGRVTVPPLNSLFAPRGRVEADGGSMRGPCCLVADSSGAEIVLGSAGWIVAPSSSSEDMP